MISFVESMHLFNLEINMNSVPSAAVNVVAGQVANNPVISHPIPQPAVPAKPGVSRSELLPGNN